MIFNRWRKYPKRKPKNEGQYQCIVKFGFGGQIEKPTVLDLFWWYAPDRGGVWIDRRRKNVFDGYKVYESCRAPIEDNRVFGDSLCERVDVVAWRKMPRIPWGFRSKKKERQDD